MDFCYYLHKNLIRYGPESGLVIHSLAWQSTSYCIPYHTGNPVRASPKLGGILRVPHRCSGLVRIQLMKTLSLDLLLAFKQEPHQMGAPRD